VDAEQRRRPLVRDISRGAKLGIAMLLVLVLVVGAGNLWASYAQSQSTRQEFAAFRQRLAAQQQAQRAASLAFEKKLCTTLGRLAALRPPAGDSASNPSRAYEQDLHDVLAQLGPDVRCPPA
jgi:type II secretory pathway pseudopilin PulG